MACQLRLVWVMLVTENREKNPDTLFKKTDEDYWKIYCISIGIRGMSSSHHSSSESCCMPTCLPPAHLPLCLFFDDPVFSLPFSPHCLFLLTLSLDHLLRCLVQSVPLCWTPQPWVFHSLLLRLSWCSRRSTFWGTSHPDPAVLWQICWADSCGAQWLQPALRLALSWTIFSAK